MNHKLNNEGIMLVLSSPSGAGKTTISNLLIKKEGESSIVRSISMTTRKPRPGEINGKDYIFVTEEEFLHYCNSGKMLEYAKVFNHYYGIPLYNIKSNIDNGISVVFSIDWQGAFKLMDIMGKYVVSIFILPPSIKELENRLNKRGGESSQVIRDRLVHAPFELEQCMRYDYVIVNNDVEESVEVIRGILNSEKLKVKRQINLKNFLAEMLC